MAPVKYRGWQHSGSLYLLTTPDGAKLNEFVVWLQPKAGTYLPTELAYDGGL